MLHLVPKKSWCRAKMLASYGIEDWANCTMGPCRSCSKFLPDFQREKWSKWIHAKVVPWLSMRNIPFRIKTVELEKSRSRFTQLLVDHSLQPPPLNNGIMLFLLMIFLIDVGSTLCKRRIRTS